MLHGKPPSPSSAAAVQPLEAARGELREGLGALRNLTQLLQSVKTGPKALVPLLPDVHAACDTLRRASSLLLDEYARRLPMPDAVIGLRQLVEPSLAELEQQLSISLNRPMNAKVRLSLEQVVTRIARDLDGARELMSGLDLAIWGPRVRVDLLGLAWETSRPDGGIRETPGATTRATLSCPRGIELVVNPGVVMALLGIGVELTARAGQPRAVPHVLIERSASNQTFVTITRDGADGDSIELSSRRLLPPTLACARAMSVMNDAELVCAADHARFQLIWARS